MTDAAVARFSSAIPVRRRIARKAPVFQAGDPLQSLYAVRVGVFKSYALTEDAGMQITRFLMPGDLLGLDAIATGRHTQTVESLAYGELCHIPYAAIKHLASEMPDLFDAMQNRLASTLDQSQSLIVMLGSMRAEARVTAAASTVSTDGTNCSKVSSGRS